MMVCAIFAIIVTFIIIVFFCVVCRKRMKKPLAKKADYNEFVREFVRTDSKGSAAMSSEMSSDPKCMSKLSGYRVSTDLTEPKNQMELK